MWYLFLQIWMWLLLTFIIGWGSHWFLTRRSETERDQNETDELAGDDGG